LRLLFERGGAEPVRELEPLAEEVPRLGALVRPAQRRAELDERSRVFESRL
jgi:hypothetical protein